MLANCKARLSVIPYNQVYFKRWTKKQISGSEKVAYSIEFCQLVVDR